MDRMEGPDRQLGLKFKNGKAHDIISCSDGSKMWFERLAPVRRPWEVSEEGFGEEVANAGRHPCLATSKAPMKTPFDRGGLRFFLVLAGLVRGCATNATILAGVPFIVLGTALHFWAKGCLRQNQVLAMGGPYRFVRHPFYLANALIDAGVAVMSGWWVLQVVLPVWWLAIYIPVMRKEENYLTDVFGAAYEEYKKQTPRLIPWRRPRTAGARVSAGATRISPPATRLAGPCDWRLILCCSSSARIFATRVFRFSPILGTCRR